MSLLAGLSDEAEYHVRNGEGEKEGHTVSLHIGDGVILHDGLKLGEPPVREFAFVNFGVRITHDSDQQVHAHNAEENFVEHQKEPHEDCHGTVQGIVETVFMSVRHSIKQRPDQG